MFVTAIIAAGGRGARFGAAEPKQFVVVGGRPILERSVTAFLEHPAVHEVIVSMPQELVADSPSYLRHSPKPLHIVAGGPRRQDSVANAFALTTERTDVVVIHDAARPFVSADVIMRTIAAAAESGAALAAVPARDTVKRARTADHFFQGSGRPGKPGPVSKAGHDRDWREQYVDETLPRETIFLAQTPQAFRRGVLQAALAVGVRDHIDATDEAALAERAGHHVRLVEGEASNIKITTPEDLVIAEAIACRGGSAEGLGLPHQALLAGSRAGTGYDLHRLVPGRPLVLGGVTVASDRGALGHSDADVVCHAITDAILGAAGHGDIGRHFPDSDPRWKNASSLDLLSRAVGMIRSDGFEVGNVDVTVILETPKIRDHIEAMRKAVGAAIGIDAAQVSIKGKTNEGLDAIGRSEAVAAHAVALLSRSRKQC
jgi:2-C-methyl-D-erythritol 4-phosphate cytidylyltransferase / 2-C-methyl-D-erythritol 2,4-cyclodiphosphate synthase